MAIDGRRLNVSATSPYPGVAKRRNDFDAHVSSCADCQPALCSTANALWRSLCLAALRAQQ